MGLALDALDLDRDEIERRFAWARQRAQPAWLWPDIDPTEWRRATLQIEASIRPILAGGKIGEPLDGDPRAVGLAGYVSGMGPLLGCWLETGLLHASPAIADVLGLQLRHNRIRMERLTDEAASAVTLLCDAGIAPTILKGMDTAYRYFPEPAARPCSDIDILVAERDMPSAETALERAGYQAGPFNPRTRGRNWTLPSAPTRLKSLTFVHCDDPWSLDVQATLDRHPSQVSVARLQPLAGAADAEPWSVSPRARVLGQPLLALQLAAHASEDLNGLTLLRLVELVSVIRRDLASGRLSWEAAATAGRGLDALGFVYPALKFAEDLLPGTVPHRLLGECEAKAPAAVRRVLRGHSPATVHRVDRWSLREQYMWCPTWKSRLLRTARLLVPGDECRGLGDLPAFYGWRFRRVLKAALRW